MRSCCEIREARLCDWESGYFTSHVFLSFVDHKRISTVLLLFLVGLFMLMCVGNDPNLPEAQSEKS